MRAFKLKKMADVRRFLSRIINQLDAGEIEESKGRTLAYMASILKMVIETGDLEKRLETIEKRLKESDK